MFEDSSESESAVHARTDIHGMHDELDDLHTKEECKDEDHDKHTKDH